ncbi:MAG: dUTP diphosphatase [Eubacteriaceae bacterium]|nr:dUTP diphosphatase [Eubacteriaceae bacterium]
MPKSRVIIVNRSAHPIPEYATPGSSGCDLRANIPEKMLVKAGQRVLIPTGIYLQLEQGTEAQIRSRSGMTLKHGIVVANGIGTVDSDYRGEISVIIANISGEDYYILPGEKIAQMVFCPVLQADFVLSDSLDETIRGSGGFGHTDGN